MDASSNTHLVLGELPMPAARGNKVLVEIHAASINPHDCQYFGFLKSIDSKFLPLPKLKLGHDISGLVVAVGGKVKNFKVGDEVFAMSAFPGAYAEYIAIDQRMLGHKPQCLSHMEAATIPMAALTSLQALRMTKLTPDSHLLVIGGSGGVGTSAIQIAKAQGATVTAVCSTKNIEFVQSLGADTVIDYTRDSLYKRDDTFDIIFDTIGNESVKKCRNILKPSSRFISTKTSFENITQSMLTRIKSRCSNTIVTGTLLALPRGKDMAQLAQLIESGKIKPLIDKTFELPQLIDAIAYSNLGRTKGKIAIAVKH